MLASKIKAIRNGRVIVKDAAGDISQYKGFFIIQRGDDNNRKFVIANSNGKELLAALSITEAQGLIDSQLKNKDAVNPSNPSSVSAAKNKAVAQGQAAVTSSGKMKDSKQESIKLILSEPISVWNTERHKSMAREWLELNDKIEKEEAKPWTKEADAVVMPMARRRDEIERALGF